MKITQKQLNGYYKAHKEFISDNDNYNTSVFGITKSDYFKIHHIVIDISGNGFDVVCHEAYPGMFAFGVDEVYRMGVPVDPLPSNVYHVAKP